MLNLTMVGHGDMELWLPCLSQPAQAGKIFPQHKVLSYFV